MNLRASPMFPPSGFDTIPMSPAGGAAQVRPNADVARGGGKRGVAAGGGGGGTEGVIHEVEQEEGRQPLSPTYQQRQ